MQYLFLRPVLLLLAVLLLADTTLPAFGCAIEQLPALTEENGAINTHTLSEHPGHTPLKNFIADLKTAKQTEEDEKAFKLTLFSAISSHQTFFTYIPTPLPFLEGVLKKSRQTQPRLYILACSLRT